MVTAGCDIDDDGLPLAFCEVSADALIPQHAHNGAAQEQSDKRDDLFRRWHVPGAQETLLQRLEGCVAALRRRGVAAR